MQERFETFTALLNRIKRSIRKIISQKFTDFDLKAGHISCIYQLYKTDGLTATDLCKRCAEDKAAISRSLNYLEENGYLVCRANQGKRYRSPFSLTDKGREIGKEISHEINLVLDEVGHGVSREELFFFYRSLFTISKRLDSIANNEERQGENVFS